MMSSVEPPWGESALDVFLLEKWDPDARITPNEQRTALVREYVDMGWRKRRRYDELAESEDLRPPTDTQVTQILKPLRSLKQRRLAHDLGDPAAIWLRTCYSEGSDAQHKALLRHFDVEDAVGSNDKILNLIDRYDFGENWQRVFDVLPELVDPGVLAPTLKKALRKMKEDVLAGKHDELARVATQRMNSSEEAARTKFKTIHQQIQRAAVTNYLVLEDAESLTTGKVFFAFIDECGRVVRQKRVDNNGIGIMRGAWMDGAWDECSPWISADVGVDYLEGGVCGPPYDIATAST